MPVLGRMTIFDDHMKSNDRARGKKKKSLHMKQEIGCYIPFRTRVCICVCVCERVDGWMDGCGDEAERRRRNEYSGLPQCLYRVLFLLLAMVKVSCGVIHLNYDN